MDIIKLMLLSRQMKNRRHEKNNTMNGIPPLTFNAIAGTLKNYRIYGNTVNGESVGERKGKVPVTICGENLFRKSEIEYNAYLEENGQIQHEVPPGITSDTSQYINIIPGKTYTLTRTGSRRVKFYGYDKNPLTNTFDADATNSDITFIAPQNAYYIRFTINRSISLKTVKLYVSDTTLIYLDAPLAKSGNNADYIDYATQKRHNSDGTESSVTLPEIAVTAGTNTFTVGTEVQPSRVELTGRIKEGES